MSVSDENKKMIEYMFGNSIKSGSKILLRLETVLHLFFGIFEYVVEYSWIISHNHKLNS